MIYWDRLMGGVLSAVAEAVPGNPTIVWAPSEYPRDAAGDFIALRIISGPDIRDGRYEALGGARFLPTTIRVTCTNSNNALGRIAATGAFWLLEVGNPETVEAYRDRWVAELITAGKALDAVITPFGTDSFDVTGADLWSLYGLSVTGAVTASTTSSVDAIARTTDALVQVEVQCFSQTRYAYGGALETSTRISSSLDLPSVYDILNSRGLAVISRSPIVDLTSLSGPGWESRAAFTLDISMRSFIAEPISLIEEVTVSPIEVKADDGVLISSISLTQGLP